MQRACYYYQRGNCAKGNRCRYIHSKMVTSINEEIKQRKPKEEKHDLHSSCVSVSSVDDSTVSDSTISQPLISSKQQNKTYKEDESYLASEKNKKTKRKRSRSYSTGRTPTSPSDEKCNNKSSMKRSISPPPRSISPPRLFTSLQV